MNTNNTTANTSTFPDSWDDLWKLDQPLLFDFEAFLTSDLIAARRNQISTIGVIRHTTGSVSTIASTCLVLHILRSHRGLSTTYHRLVFGLSVADIMSSFAMALGSPMTNGAEGNELTVTRQLALLRDSLLNKCGICVYYLVSNHQV